MNMTKKLFNDELTKVGTMKKKELLKYKLIIKTKYRCNDDKIKKAILIGFIDNRIKMINENMTRIAFKNEEDYEKFIDERGNDFGEDFDLIKGAGYPEHNFIIELFNYKLTEEEKRNFKDIYNTLFLN